MIKKIKDFLFKKDNSLQDYIDKEIENNKRIREHYEKIEEMRKWINDPSNK